MTKRAKPKKSKPLPKPIALTKLAREMRSALAMLNTRIDSIYEDFHRNDCLTHRRLEALTDLLQILTDSHTGTYATLIDHCARLLREKETLQKRLDTALNPPMLTDVVPGLKCYERPARSFWVTYQCGCSANGPTQLPNECGIHPGSMGVSWTVA